MKTAKRIALATLSTTILVGTLATAANAATTTHSTPESPTWGQRGVHAFFYNHSGKTLKIHSHRTGKNYEIDPGGRLECRNGYSPDLPEVELSIAIKDGADIGKIDLANPFGIDTYPTATLKVQSGNERYKAFKTPGTWEVRDTKDDRTLGAKFEMHDQSEDYKEFTVDITTVIG